MNQFKRMSDASSTVMQYLRLCMTRRVVLRCITTVMVHRIWLELVRITDIMLLDVFRFRFSKNLRLVRLRIWKVEIWYIPNNKHALAVMETEI